MTLAEDLDVPDLVVSGAGEDELLRIAVRAELVQPRVWNLCLYDNDYEPDRAVVLADLDEVTWTGYARVPITPEDWSEPVQIAGRGVSYWGPAPTDFFPFSGSHTVFGYFITFMAGITEKLLWVQRFDNPQICDPATPVRVWPVLTSRSESEPTPPP